MRQDHSPYVPRPQVAFDGCVLAGYASYTQRTCWPSIRTWGPEREDAVARKYGAVFVIVIGGQLADGTLHDGRAPDYDDWITPTGNGKKGLNGDIILWYPLLERGLEISSMGICVDPSSLVQQLDIRGVPQGRGESVVGRTQNSESRSQR